MVQKRFCFEFRFIEHFESSVQGELAKDSKYTKDNESSSYVETIMVILSLRRSANAIVQGSPGKVYYATNFTSLIQVLAPEWRNERRILIIHCLDSRMLQIA